MTLERYVLSFRSHLSSKCIPFATIAIALVLIGGESLLAQSNFQNFDASQVFQRLDSVAENQPPLTEGWWDPYVSQSLRNGQQMPTDIHTLLFLAIHHSNEIKIAKRDPLIRETAVMEADSSFDWVRYLRTSWNDTNEPVGNALTVGGTANRFNDHVFQGTAGVRRLTRYGGQLDINQRFGWQNNNSQFFTPNDQATGQFSVSYTHPLLKGNGFAYNNAIVFLAEVDSRVAKQEFLAKLQDELLETTRAYWSLYLERAILTQQTSLYLKTEQIYQALNARRGIDAGRTQLVTASSALESRRADLIRGRTAVSNAETRLRGMVNAPELGNTNQVELIPVEKPSVVFYPLDLESEVQLAVQNRPEIQAAIKQVKAGSKRLGIAEHEMLPVLNLVTEGYVSGLRGDSQFGRAFGDQFSEGAPSYSIGLQYELPVGNRLAKSRLCRRRHELARLKDEYARALQLVQTEVDVAVRELKTSYSEIAAKSRALIAAQAESETIFQRWSSMVDGGGTSALNLESLLRAQERVLEAENDYARSLVTYNLAMVALKRANGSLLQSESVTVSNGVTDGCNEILLDKGESVKNVLRESVKNILPMEVLPERQQ